MWVKRREVALACVSWRRALTELGLDYVAAADELAHAQATVAQLRHLPVRQGGDLGECQHRRLWTACECIHA